LILYRREPDNWQLDNMPDEKYNRRQVSSCSDDGVGKVSSYLFASQPGGKPA
jgi:hypothetical protein